MTKKVMVSFPEGFLEAVDRVAEEQHCSRSELIRDALWVYMTARQGAQRPGDLPRVRAAVASMHALAQVAPGTGEDSTEDVRRWRDRRR